MNWLKKLSFDNFSIFIPFLFKQQKIGSDFNSYGTKNKGEIQTKISYVLISIILWFILHNMMTICYNLHNVTIYTSIWLIHALTVLKECMFYNNCVYLLCNICCWRGGEVYKICAFFKWLFSDSFEVKDVIPIYMLYYEESI